MTNVNVQLLAADAAINGDTEALVQAVAMDPLTSAVCTLKEIREMSSEMLEAERQWLPQFEGKTVTPRPAVAHPGKRAGHRPRAGPGPGHPEAIHGPRGEEVGQSAGRAARARLS